MRSFLLCLITCITFFSPSVHAENDKPSLKSESLLENFSFEQGKQFLQVIQKEYPYLLEKFDLFRLNDQLSNLVTYDYGSAGLISPLTLYYIQTAGDLKKHFGDLKRLNICEIGGAQGGLCLILALAEGFESYTFINSPCEDQLQSNLKLPEIKNLRFVHLKNMSHPITSDLVLSFDFFDKFTDKEQENCFKLLFKNSKNGFLTFTTHPPSSMSIYQVIHKLMHMNKEGFIAFVKKQGTCIWKDPKSIFGIEKIKNPVVYPQNNKAKTESAISYSFSGGNLGDNLLSYLHAKWLSLKLNMPLMMRLFPLAEEFIFSEEELVFTDEALFNHEIIVKNWNQFSTHSPTLFTVPYFPENKREAAIFKAHYPFIFEVDWYDPVFRHIVKKMLSPKTPPQKLELPKDCVTVALHIRSAKEEDGPVASFWCPLKFPPESYYIQQLKRTAEVYAGQKLYVFLFTEHNKPRVLLERLQKELNNPLITFDCRSEGFDPRQNILNDLFHMAQFDCLIRPLSNYSMMAGLLKDYELMIEPKNHRVYTKEARTEQDVEIHFKPRKSEGYSITNSIRAFLGL